MRWAPILVLLLSLRAGAEEPADPKAEYTSRWQTLASLTSAAHLDLGRFCTGKKLHEPAWREYRRAAELDPQNAGAQKALGRKQEGGAWVDDPKAAVKKLNEGPATEWQASCQ